MTSISITIKEQNITRLEELAEAMDRSRSWIANEAIEQFLAHQDWMDRETNAAITDIDAGAPMASHEDVVGRLKERRKAKGL